MCGLFTFKKLIAESEWFTTYLPNEYNTRLSNMSALILPNLMTSHSRLSVWWVGASVWNGLPGVLRDVSLSYNVFKRQLKKVLTNRQKVAGLYDGRQLLRVLRSCLDGT